MVGWVGYVDGGYYFGIGIEDRCCNGYWIDWYFIVGDCMFCL